MIQATVLATVLATVQTGLLLSTVRDCWQRPCSLNGRQGPAGADSIFFSFNRLSSWPMVKFGGFVALAHYC
jgi:hypothetical protein